MVSQYHFDIQLSLALIWHLKMNLKIKKKVYFIGDIYLRENKEMS